MLVVRGSHRVRRNWLGRVTALRPAKPPWPDVLRSGLFLPGPMALGLATGQVAAGLFGTLGALLGILAERSGTTGQRVTRISLAAGGGVVAMLLGPHTAGTGVAPLLVVAGFACVSGVVSSVHPTLSFAGMQLLVQMSVAGGLSPGVARPVLLAWYVGAVAWVLLGVLVQGAVERTSRRYRTEVAGAVSALADAVRGGEPGLLAAQTAIAATDDLVALATPVRPALRGELEALFGITSRLPEVATAAAAAVQRADPRVRTAFAGEVDEVAAAIAARRAPALPADPADPADPAAERLVRRARTLLLAAAAAPPHDRAGQWRARSSRRIVDALTSASTRAYTVRVALCMTAAELVRQADPVAHSYWVLITVAICLKPDFQAVLARTLQRIAGTLIGALPAVLLVRATSHVGQLVAMGLLACGIPYTVRRNYGLFAILITPIVLIVLHFGGPVGGAGVVERIVNTLLGGCVVLVFGYVLWPGTWRPPSRTRIARLLTTLASVLDPAVGDTGRARARVYAELADLRTVTGHGPYEPPAVRARRLLWSDVVDGALAVVTAGTRVAGTDDASRLPGAAARLRTLSEAVRGRVPWAGPYGSGAPAPAGEVDEQVVALAASVARVWPPRTRGARRQHRDSPAEPSPTDAAW
ncbi:FUSC family protein [Actinacidiphila acididurans]|uniref:FUSC family protein n=1 Tax=Actinacidiphila acididurans TaxID=2784346 RepID=A0ABS2TL67_9ACTN|nr:FUSC family protein [Actinacidiphila acididurans]MBM9504069.1 FUSC family protein [Actinacidiphila acididurans]